MSPQEFSDKNHVLFTREGVYHVRVQHSTSGEPIEIALHGIATEEQARIAIAAMTASESEPVY